MIRLSESSSEDHLTASFVAKRSLTTYSSADPTLFYV